MLFLELFFYSREKHEKLLNYLDLDIFQECFCVNEWAISSFYFFFAVKIMKIKNCSPINIFLILLCIRPGFK